MTSPVTMGAQPYGPNTAAIRRFLVRLAGLGTDARAQATAAYEAQASTRGWILAETALATAIERSGREPQRDALSGPLLQLVQRDVAGTTLPADDEQVMDTLDPVAEPALAALLALLVYDLLDRAQVTCLMAPFDGIIPLADVTTGAG